MRTFQKILTLFIGIGAVAGAVMMWIDSTGTSWGGEPLLEMLRAKMPWPDVFFKNFIPSGFVLLFLNGITQFVAAYLLFKKRRLAQHAVLACGIILMLWIVLEWWVWGFNALSNIYFMLGLVETITAVISMRKTIFVCLAMTDAYIDTHYAEIKKHGSDIEVRLDDADCTIERLKEDNHAYIEGCQKYSEQVVMIDTDYQQTINKLIAKESFSIQ